ncbi:Mfa1 family fimbria major subunit [Segatella copri]|uniref:Mfa1 family fimbria major subunit n=1 Tax=Segatella copri TaxID=165179 RepID=UPI001C44AE10|nr:Mfa1 family fimbria major subunit [Segatella copri]MBW0022872.1 Mfa1 family fimbria major subunit [Segatella copri]MBW0038234.1 Mfa1 family fimbria major subunit [Segatella copri]
MKKTLLFSVALAGLMLGSCSSSDDLNGGGNNTGSNQSGDGYVSLSLNLPTRSGSMSRAENDNFNDGLADEYAVKNGTLILFEGANETDATFAGAYELKNLSMNLVGTTTDNITTTTKITQKINNGLSSGTNNFYAIVVLNNNGTLAVDGTNASLKVNGEDFPSTKKISDLQSLELTKNASDFNTTGFLMMNAPLSNVAGGATEPTGATVSVASKIDKDHIYATEALAKANSSASIYVERALAKVDVTASKPTGNLEDGAKVSYTVKGWVLDNTNKKTYYLRNTSNSSEWLSLKTTSTVPTKPYRFVGDNPMESSVKLYRTYWAKDPNYDVKPSSLSEDFNTIGNKAPASLKSLGEHDYCLENTFNVPQQTQDVTTRVIIAAQLKDDGKTFYVVNDNESELLDEDKMKEAVKSAFLNNTDVQAWIKTGLKAGEKIDENDLDVTVASTAGNNVPTVSVNATGNAKYTSGAAPTVTADITNIMNAIKVATYENGISYYPVRIKHFGDELTPWKSSETPLPTVSTGAYPTNNQAANYLGRYGVLRNNWYNIDVQGIKKLGSPVVPEVTGDTDDELAAYISVKINVLSWAKRTQGATLGE